MNRLLDALQGNSSNDIRVYDVNKEKAIRLLKGAGTKPAGGLFLSDDFNNSITEDGLPVKNCVEEDTNISGFSARFREMVNCANRRSALGQAIAAA